MNDDYMGANRDPGIINTILNKVGDRPDDDESFVEEIKDTATGGGEDRPAGESRPHQEMVAESRGPADAPSNQGNFGTADDIRTDNAAVRNAARGLDDEAMARGPANTDPDIAQGSV